MVSVYAIVCCWCLLRQERNVEYNAEVLCVVGVCKCLLRAESGR